MKTDHIDILMRLHNTLTLDELCKLADIAAGMVRARPEPNQARRFDKAYQEMVRKHRREQG